MSFLIENENNLIKYWNKNNIFKESLEINKNNPKFIHIQGPPFATGKMHYGHYLTETIKDIICRYKTMKQFYVERTATWDTHGLPIEYEIEKELGIKTKEEIIKYGIKKYNKKCSEIVLRCIDDWKYGLNRIGRWIDFDNQCKTMDLTYMESLFWIFKNLYDNNLIYKGFKVMPYSTTLATPLSNFEAKSSYKEITEESIIVSFKLLNHTNIYILVWTTTPWTLPANLALCINKNIEYVLCYHVKHLKYYIISLKLINKVFKNNEIEVQCIYDISTIINTQYEPLFDYNLDINKNKSYYILEDNFVSNDSGTGIVHLAPAFGEDDFRVCLNNNIISKDGEGLICPINDNGNYTNEIYDFKGLYIKDCDKLITNKLKNNNQLIKRINITHQYPYCWRSDTPLIYKAVSSWFINVEKIKDKLINNNKLTNWIPDHIKSKRFTNWLNDAKDWCISRNRYWGTPIPIWTSDDMEEIVCIGSIEELEELANLEKGSVTNLHRDYIDDIQIPSKKGKGMLKRNNSGILDCWFESGSILYAKSHYPFENKLNDFTIDFIAEGLDQTRGWFYCLMIISTALFNKPAFNNVIVNGLVLAENGKKMSKRLKNYTDPNEIINKYGADALRMYLIDSPVTKAESLRFNNIGVSNIVKTILIPLYNSYNFFNEHYTNFIKNNNTIIIDNNINNSLDKWIQGKINKLIYDIDNDLNSYKLYNIVNKIQLFIDQFNNGYIKLNRDCIKGKNGNWNNSLASFASILYNISIILAPIIPFFADFLFLKIKDIFNINTKSVHLLNFNDFIKFEYYDHNIYKIDKLMNILNLVRQLRADIKLNLKIPLTEILIGDNDIDDELKYYILNETNILDMKIINYNDFVNIKFQPVQKTVGKTFKKNNKIICDFINNMNNNDIELFNKQQFIQYNDFNILPEHIEQKFIINEIDNYKHIYDNNNNLIIFINTIQTENTSNLYYSRLFINNIQQLRKKAKLSPWNQINIYYKCDDLSFINIINTNYQYIFDSILYPITYINSNLKKNHIIIKDTIIINDINIEIIITY